MTKTILNQNLLIFPSYSEFSWSMKRMLNFKVY